MMLSGYLPSPEAIQAVGRIGRELRLKCRVRPGAFFWGKPICSFFYRTPSILGRSKTYTSSKVLDPVMGDGGRFYVPEASAPAYRSLLRDCDLILPNQFELETLSNTKITGMKSLADAIQKLHLDYQLPHIFVTSTQLSESDDVSGSGERKITVVGSTARMTDRSPRLFRIDVPYYPVYFTGTGDMLAALLVARFREAAAEAGLLGVSSWVSPDDVAAPELPLAKAAEKVVASMQAILQKTYHGYLAEKEMFDEAGRRTGQGEADEDVQAEDRKRELFLSKAVELRLVRNIGDVMRPQGVEKYGAVEVQLD
jgi:pyridoxine kinase